MNHPEQVLDHALFVRSGRRINPLIALLQFHSLVDQQRNVAAVVDYQLRSLAAGEAERLVRTPPVLLQRLALPGEDRHAGGSNRRRSVVLGGEDVATRPAHIRAQDNQGLDQHRGLDGHVQRPGDAHACQRLVRGVLVADGHQPRHLVLGDVDLLAAEAGQTNVRDLVLRRTAQNCLIDRCRCHSKTPRGISLSGWSAEATTPLSGYHRNPFTRGFLRERQTIAVSGANPFLNGDSAPTCARGCQATL